MSTAIAETIECVNCRKQRPTDQRLPCPHCGKRPLRNPDAPIVAPDERAPTTPNGRTLADAVNETERLLQETIERYDENASADWLITRVVKAAEALSDRPK